MQLMPIKAISQVGFDVKLYQPLQSPFQPHEG